MSLRSTPIFSCRRGAVEARCSGRRSRLTMGIFRIMRLPFRLLLLAGCWRHFLSRWDGQENGQGISDESKYGRCLWPASGLELADGLIPCCIIATIAIAEKNWEAR